MEQLLLNLKEIVLENNQMLRKICNYIDKVESPEFIQKSEEKEFALNVAADLYVEKLEQLRRNNKHE